MKRTNRIDPAILLEDARKSEYRESYMLLVRNKNYRVGVGAEIAISNEPSFFFEILVYLCSGNEEVNLELLEKALRLLKELKAKGFSFSCQDSNCISCQRTVSAGRLAAEQKDIESMVKRVYA
jgi:hypothetical protein